jgi:hypothetical protein
VPLHPIIISILFHHYKELKECIREVEALVGGEANKVNNGDKREQDQEEQDNKEMQGVVPIAPTNTTITTTTIDSYFIKKTIHHQEEISL